MRYDLNKKSRRFKFKPKRGDRLDRGFSQASMSPLSTMRGKPAFRSSRSVRPGLSRTARSSQVYSFSRRQQKIFQPKVHGGLVSIAIVAVAIAVGLLVGRHVSTTPSAVGVTPDASDARSQRASSYPAYLDAYVSGGTSRLAFADASLVSEDAAAASFATSRSSGGNESGELSLSAKLTTVVSAQQPLPDSWSMDTEAVTYYVRLGEPAAQSLETMVANMQLAGLNPVVVSGYRSYNTQSELFNAQVAALESQGAGDQQAQAQAAQLVEQPGTSEHESGLAVDIVAQSVSLADGLSSSLTDQIAQTPEAQWLAQHCTEYGFILRYPADKTDVTGVAYEPWHFRYVGTDAAARMLANGQALEEYAASSTSAAAASAASAASTARGSSN